MGSEGWSRSDLCDICGYCVAYQLGEGFWRMVVSEAERPRVLVVSNVRLYRDGLTQVLNEDGRLGLARGAASGAAAVEEVERCQPESVLLDASMPEALRTISMIAQKAPRTKVIALGLSESEEDVVACAEAGIAGYVRREGSVEDVVTTVRRALRDEFGCSRRIAAALVRRVRNLRAGRVGETALTPREREIAALLGEGLSNKEISADLHIEVATVKTHVHNILEKTGAHSRGEAAAKLRRMEEPRFEPGLARRRQSTI